MWSESRGCNSCETETKISQTSARVEPALIILVANEEFSFYLWPNQKSHDQASGKNNFYQSSFERKKLTKPKAII